jgi:hypothetical protein
MTRGIGGVRLPLPSHSDDGVVKQDHPLTPRDKCVGAD